MSRHLYYQIFLTLESSLSLGSGEAKNSDRDMIRNSKSEPIIPATSLAGVYRSCLSEKEKDWVFGYINKEELQQSKVKVYDATLLQESFETVRDCVALDPCKVAKQGAKFDFEIVEKGAVFLTYLEVEKENESEKLECLLEEIFSKVNSGQLLFGAKTTRGYGKVSLQVYKREFHFPHDLEQWLSFSMFEEWKEKIPVCLQEIENKEECRISLKLVLVGGISIRKYMTAVFDSESAPDYGQLSTHKKIPVIPGTSWAGAFRHHCAKLGYPIQEKQSMFGYVNDERKEEAKKSRIQFSESYLEGGREKQITRNAIDRFSGGAKQGALYTEQAYFGGTCNLEIALKQGSKIEKQYLSACLLDLHHGFLAVGGLTAIGRGLFQIQNMNVNGQEISISGEEFENCHLGGILS